MKELAWLRDRGSIVLSLQRLHQLVQDDELRDSPDAAAIYHTLEFNVLRRNIVWVKGVPHDNKLTGSFPVEAGIVELMTRLSQPTDKDKDKANYNSKTATCCS